MADDRATTPSEEDMATLAHALKDLEASTITPDQFWNRLNRTRELRFAVMFSLMACIKKLTAYRDEAPPMPPLDAEPRSDL
jgi:hypothetical protein